MEDNGRVPVVANMEEIALKALHTDDDSTLNPWTFRTFFLGKILRVLYAGLPCSSPVLGTEVAAVGVILCGFPNRPPIIIFH